MYEENDEENDEEDYDTVYTMEDPDAFINQIRRLIFAGFGLKDLADSELQHLLDEIDEEEMERTISFAECKLIAMEYLEAKKIRRKIKYFLTEENFTNLVEAINARLVSNLITELVDMGQLESAWDNESNDFIFWVPEND
jgi:hypothetical protein